MNKMDKQWNKITMGETSAYHNLSDAEKEIGRWFYMVGVKGAMRMILGDCVTENPDNKYEITIEVDNLKENLKNVDEYIGNYHQKTPKEKVKSSFKQMILNSEFINFVEKIAENDDSKYWVDAVILMSKLRKIKNQ